MNEEKNYLDDIKSPIQKKSIKDIPVPTRKKDRVNSVDMTPIKKVSARRTIKKDLDLREEMKISDIKKEPISNFINEQRDKEPIAINDFARKIEEENEEFTQTHYRHNRSNNNEGKGFPFILTFASVVALILIFVGISTFFSSAKVIITLKTSELTNLNIDIPIIDEKVGNKELLNYKILEINETAAKTVEAEKEESVETKASGVITIYNEFNTEGQKLIQNTRFETKEGLVYRIKNSITVPGYTESAGKKTPGSIDVEVFADQPGEKYNIGLTDFKIPGFKDQEQYNFFYAKSKTEMSGGFVGTKNTVSEQALNDYTTELQGQITEKIIAKIKEQNTENYMYVYSPKSFVFLAPKQNNASGKKVEISFSGNAKVYVIEKSELSKKVAEKGGRDYDGNPVLIKNPEALTITLKENNIENNKEVIQNNEILNISGDVTLVWQNDLEQIKKDLAGKNKKELFQIISKYPGITKADAIFNLIWNSDFPKKTNKINIEIE